MPVLEFWRNQVPVYGAVCILTALGHGGLAWKSMCLYFCNSVICGLLATLHIETVELLQPESVVKTSKSKR